MIVLTMLYNHVIRYKNQTDFLVFEYQRELYLLEKIRQKWSIPAQLIISQHSKVLESLNWYQMIAMTMFYNHVIRYINKLADIMLKYSRALQILEKNKR